MHTTNALHLRASVAVMETQKTYFVLHFILKAACTYANLLSPTFTNFTLITVFLGSLAQCEIVFFFKVAFISPLSPLLPN